LIQKHHTFKDSKNWKCHPSGSQFGWTLRYGRKEGRYWRSFALISLKRMEPRRIQTDSL
jgi:hypothetical protein